MLRSTVARLLSRRGSVIAPPRFAADLAAAVDETVALSEPSPERQYTSVVLAYGLPQLIALRRDAQFREAFAVADLVVASSWLVAWLASKPDASVKRVERKTFLFDLAVGAAQRNLPVFLVGSSAAVIGRAGEELVHRTEGGIDIAGSAALSADFDPEGAEADRVLLQLQRSGARICFIGLPTPKQEIFAAHAVKMGLDCTLICTGQALDLAPGALMRQITAVGYERIAHLGVFAAPGL